MSANLRGRLDRNSFVPLYYQLQEVLKEGIESGHWAPGDPLPSETTLAATYGISRVVVRHALAILADDGQVIRRRGRGTFVAEPKLAVTPGGLLQSLDSGDACQVLILDVTTSTVDPIVRERLMVSSTEPVVRITSQVHLGDQPIAIIYSYARTHDLVPLEPDLAIGRWLSTGTRILSPHAEATRVEAVIESSQCGQFEADRFGVASRTQVFLMLCTHHGLTPDGERPVEVARAEYRADCLMLSVSPGQAGTPTSGSGPSICR